MRILILAVGRARAGPELSLYQHFAKRITWALELREIEEKKPGDAKRLAEREGERLRDAIPEGAVVVALDERGKSLPSREFADRIGTWRDDGVGNLVFVIGGADGLHQSVRHRADLLISFGAQTWPHMLVRGLLAEQIYRAQCILSGHPYHRD